MLLYFLSRPLDFQLPDERLAGFKIKLSDQLHKCGYREGCNGIRTHRQSVVSISKFDLMIAEWARNTIKNKEHEARQAELLSRLIVDQLPPEASILPPETVLWGIYYSSATDAMKQQLIEQTMSLENRSQRCALGFLISWNGFKETVTKEKLRGSREQIMLVPMTGEDIRRAVRSGDFVKTLLECWDNAINLKQVSAQKSAPWLAIMNIAIRPQTTRSIGI
jgi:hypothetical protein